MNPIPPIVQEAEGLLRRAATEVSCPRAGECLCCYVARMLDEFPCDGSHRHAIRYRDAMAPRATALAKRLGQLGACCCDCELFLNGYQLRASLVEYRIEDGDDDADEDDDDYFDDDDSADPRPVVLPGCRGVRRGSLRPCDNWLRIRRW
jgi:Protein of unknown function (DUF2695)